MRLRDLDAADLPRIVSLNDAAYPAVPITSEGEMGDLLALAGFAFAVVDEPDGALLGFVIGMRPGSAYASENYRYFETRGSHSLYVDRIVVDEAWRGQRIGQLLYAAVFELADEEGRDEVTCEVNLDPPNPGSLAFHARLGFERVGEQATKGGSVTVALLAAAVDRARSFL
jgi:predicted GNAT superfamily acetyltransferase